MFITYVSFWNLSWSKKYIVCLPTNLSNFGLWNSRLTIF